MNLRTRFAILTSALVLVVTMAMSLGGYTIASNQLERQVDTSLNQRATRILAIVADPRFSWNDAFGRGPVNQAILQTEVDAITQVMLPDGQVIKRREYPTLPMGEADRALEVGEQKVHRSSTVIDGKRFRTLTVRLNDGSWLQLAKDMQVVINARNGMRRWFPVLAALQVVIAALVGWWFARRISRPIENLASAAETIAATQDLSHDIPTAGAGEVGALAASFNTMVAALRRSLSRQRQLVQDASHELRTPLTAVGTSLDLALTTTQNTELIKAAKRDLKDMGMLIERLLELARLDTFAFHAEPVDVTAIVSATLDAHEHMAKEKNVTITRSLAKSVTHSADPSMLRQVVSNLVGNAVKFHNSGGVVAVTLTKDALLVHDNGPGITPDALPKIFDRFYRADEARSRASDGLGLGLSLVKRIVDVHGWTIKAESAPGKGTLFTARF